MLDRVRYTLRFKYRKGHSIHSPFVYRMVRTLFMPETNRLLPANATVLNALLSGNMRKKVAYRIAQLYVYLSFGSFALGSADYRGEDMVVWTDAGNTEALDRFVRRMQADAEHGQRRLALVVKDIYKTKKMKEWWSAQNQLKLDLYWAGIILFDTNLNSQTFKLRL